MARVWVSSNSPHVQSGFHPKAANWEMFTAGCSTAELSRNAALLYQNYLMTVNAMRNDKRTYKDRSEYLKQAVTKRRKKLRKMALDLKGGKCEICGYERCGRALNFHHLDPSKKDFSIGTQGYTKSWDTIKNEVSKCALVCANCHMEIHEGLLKI